MTLEDLVHMITSRRTDAGHPIVVGISGYGGSGKSTLARALAAKVPGAVRLRGDDFLDPTRSHQRSATWDGVDRARLVRDVLVPFRERRASMFQRFDWSTRALAAKVPGAVRLRGDDFLDPTRSHQRSATWDGVDRARLVRDVLVPFRERRASMFQRFDWSTRALGTPEPVPAGEVMLVDLIGLFCPETAEALDLRVWCDVDLDTATLRGMARDARFGCDHVELWQHVWGPNERDFVERFDPRATADVVLPDAIWAEIAESAGTPD